MLKSNIPLNGCFDSNDLAASGHLLSLAIYLDFTITWKTIKSVRLQHTRFEEAPVETRCPNNRDRLLDVDTPPMAAMFRW